MKNIKVKDLVKKLLELDQEAELGFSSVDANDSLSILDNVNIVKGSEDNYYYFDDGKYYYNEDILHNPYDIAVQQMNLNVEDLSLEEIIQLITEKGAIKLFDSNKIYISIF